MTIDLISQEQFDKIKKINDDFPVLFLQNVGYQYIHKKFTESEAKAKSVVEEILKKHIVGFSEFNNFRRNKKTNELELRFQYNWEADAEKPSRSYIGVGYITLNELKNGFKR